MEVLDQKTFDHYNKFRESLGLEPATQQEWKRSRNIGQKWTRAATKKVGLKFDKGQPTT